LQACQRNRCLELLVQKLLQVLHRIVTYRSRLFHQQQGEYTLSFRRTNLISELQFKMFASHFRRHHLVCHQVDRLLDETRVARNVEYKSILTELCCATWAWQPRHSRQVRLAFCTLHSSSSSDMTCAQALHLSTFAPRAGAWVLPSRTVTTAQEEQACDCTSSVT